MYGESPGTDVYEHVKRTMPVFHFAFHTVLDLPETRGTGRGRGHLGHSIDRLGYRPEAVDLDFSVRLLQPGALHAGFDLYRALATR